MKSTTYLESYKDHGIRRLKRGYYCEFCNVLHVTKPKVAHHVKEDTHKYNRGILLLKEVENGVLAFDKVFIEAKAWHGLVDDTCIICDIDFKDDNMHMNDSTHVFKLIQMKLEFFEGNILRKCKELYTRCMNKDSQMDNRVINVDDVINTTTYPAQESDTKKKDLSRKGTNLPQTKIAKPEIENETPKVDEEPCKVDDNSYEASSRKNLDSESDTANLYQPHEAVQIAKSFANNNGIKFKYGNHSAFCQICNVTISSSLKRMKEHVALPTHGENFRKPRSNNITKTLSSVFINKVERVTVLSGSKFSTEFIREIRHNLYHCGFCNIISQGLEELEYHLVSTSHKDKKMFFSRTLTILIMAQNRGR
ncbi:unnamed protein product, partial [Iphiclides podalirius]